MSIRFVPHDGPEIDRSTPDRPDGLMSKIEVSKYLGFSTRTLDRLIAAGEFIEHKLICGQRKRWDRAEIDRWLATRPRLNTRGRKGADRG
jgi:excisionase family DNA binding protein